MKAGSWLVHARRLNPLWSGVVVLVVVFLLYLPSLNNYLMGDDFEWLNSAYNSWRQPGQLLEKINNFFRPMVKLSYLLDYTLFGTRVVYFNLTTVLLHLANLWLLFMLALRIFGRILPSFFLTLVYGVSAYYSEVTLWAAGRPDSLMLLFILGALLLLVRHAAIDRNMPLRTHILLLLLASGALASKEAWMVLPFLALALLWLVMGVPLRRALGYTFGLFALLGLYVFFFVGLPMIRGGTIFTAYGGSGIKAMAHKAGFLFYKFMGLGDQFRGGWVELLLSASLLAAAFVIFIRRRNRVALFGLFWMLVGIGISLPVRYAAPRYNYFPLVGFWIAVIAFVAAEYRVFVRLRPRSRSLAAVIIALPLGLFIVQQALMLRWEIDDYRLRGEMHRQLATMYGQVRNQVAIDQPLIFVDLGKRRAVTELARAVKGYRKILFVRERALWQEVFLSPLANFLGEPFSRLMEPVNEAEVLSALKGKATTLVFRDQGFALDESGELQAKVLAFYDRCGELPYKVQVLRLRKSGGRA